MCSGNKKGTFDVNTVFTATLACRNRALLVLWKKKGGDTCPLCPPGSYAPEHENS